MATEKDDAASAMTVREVFFKDILCAFITKNGDPNGNEDLTSRAMSLTDTAFEELNK